MTLIQVILFIKLHFMKFLLKETIILFENKRLCDKISFSGDKIKILFTGEMKPFIVKDFDSDELLQLVLPVRTY